MEYARRIRFKKIAIVAIGILLVFAVFFSFTVGTHRIPFSQCIDIICSRIVDGPDGTIYERIVWESRIPRGIAAAFIGAGLAAAGCIMQSMLRNPLADPYTTGVSSGAGLGVAISVVLGISILPIDGTASTIANAFVLALVPAAIILIISSMRRITSTTMILIGIGVMYLFSACNQILQLIATPNQIERMYSWNLGSISEISFGNTAIIAVTVVACVLFLYRYRLGLNLMTLGDESALTLGTDPWRTRVVCLVVISFMTAVCVSFSGTIGFVGLVAPQIVRLVIGSDTRYLIPASAMFGGLFLVVCDSASRVIGIGGLPVGIITAFIGSPLFLYLLVKQSRSHRTRA